MRFHSQNVTSNLGIPILAHLQEKKSTHFFCFPSPYPTDSFADFEAQNPPIEAFEQHEVRRSANFEVLK